MSRPEVTQEQLSTFQGLKDSVDESVTNYCILSDSSDATSQQQHELGRAIKLFQAMKLTRGTFSMLLNCPLVSQSRLVSILPWIQGFELHRSTTGTTKREPEYLTFMNVKLILAIIPDMMVLRYKKQPRNRLVYSFSVKKSNQFVYNLPSSCLLPYLDPRMDIEKD